MKEIQLTQTQILIVAAMLLEGLVMVLLLMLGLYMDGHFGLPRGVRAL